jgi:hypothetical protein
MSGIAHAVEAYRPRPRPSVNSASSLWANVATGCAYLALVLSVAFMGAIVLGVIH